MADASFIGRDREVAQLELSIGPGRDGLRLAMLSGPSGLGKTTLSRVAADAAADRGFRVATVNGRAGSLSTPFAPFIDALPEFSVLLSVLAGDQVVDVEHAGIGLVNLLAELTSDQPLLLVFDDAQALDESSIALLPYLVGVSERMDLTVFFVEQTDAIGVPSSYRSFIDGMLARRVVRHLELGPMDDDSVRRLVADVLGDEACSVPAEIVERAGGNPWFAKELAEAWRRGITEIPTNIAAAATARLHSLDEIGQDIVYAVAICPEGAHIGWLEAISEQRPRHFVRTMEAIENSGLIREDGDIITVAHPLMQQALVEELSAAMRRAMHAELAEVIATVPLAEVVASRALGHHLSCAGRPDEAVAQYLRAADANEVTGQLHEAYADLRHALEAEPRIDGRIALLKRCATMATQLGNRAAVEHWAELGRLSAANGDDETYAYSLCQQYWSSSDGTMLERLQRAAALGPDRIGWAARAAACLAMLEGDNHAIVKHDMRALEIARERGDSALEALALEGAAYGLAYVGDLPRSIEFLTEAVAVGIRERLHGFVVNSWTALAESLGEALDTRRSFEEAESAIRYVRDLGLDEYLPYVLACRGRALLRAGDLEAVQSTVADVSRAQAVHGVDRFASLVALFLAEAEVESGSIVRAAELVDAAIAVTTEQGMHSWILDARLEQVRYLLRAGEFDAAIRQAGELEVDEDVAAASMATAFARHGSLQGRADMLEVARSLRPDAGSTPLVGAGVAEVDALLAKDADALRAAADAWTAAARPLDAARAQFVLGTWLAEDGRRDEAVALLKEVRTAFVAMGAVADADQASARLRGLGTRSRAKSRTTSVGPLTKRELEIARLVASGLKNSEVAATLFLAEKTVAAHLSNIYGKVEVRSRVQLTAWIRQNDPEFEAALASA